MAAALDLLLLVEWTYPYCEDPQDGPAAAFFGFPFPELRGGASSLEFLFSPGLLALDVAIRAAVLYAVLRFVLRTDRATNASRTGMGVAGTVLVSLALARVAFFVGMGSWRPRATIVPDDDGYRPMRPSGIALTLHATCRASGRRAPSRP
ncbi:MAG: hypothetical protein KDK70_34295 [Myxococcales bacterium]|nr:hypothetical protein [Myxococcales bacterium]